MTDKAPAAVAVEEPSAALTRDEIRAALFSTKHKVQRKAMTLFGVEIELEQPTLKSILSARGEEDVEKRTVDTFLHYAYVPGTKELIFEETDRQMILDWPFNQDLITIQETIADLTGIDIGDAAEELREDPLEGSS